MPDGGRFDFYYYAANNPDAVQTVGPNKDALYCHFMLHGRVRYLSHYEREEEHHGSD